MTAGPVPGTGATGRQGGTVLRHLLKAAARSPPFKVALGDLIATENPLVLENLPPQ
jgi:hypothetical protein